jgi:hypothetical protein
LHQAASSQNTNTIPTAPNLQHTLSTGSSLPTNSMN